MAEDLGSNRRAEGDDISSLREPPLRALSQGLRLPLQASRLLLTVQGVKRWALMPIPVNVGIYVVVVAGLIWWLGSWDWRLGGIEWQFWGSFGGWFYRFLDRFLDVIKWTLGLPFLFILCYFSFISVGMVVASPFHDALSERIELAIRPAGHVPPVPFWGQVRLTLRSMGHSLWIVVRQVGAMLLTLPFLFVPYIGFLPLFLVTAYFTGLGFLDVAMARHNLEAARRRLMIRGCRWQLLGIGLAMEWMFLVPFLGLILLPIGVVAGTILYCRKSSV